MASSLTKIRAEAWARLPSHLDCSDRHSSWIDANKPGASIHSFLEGPAVAPDGSLWATDIPYGRIFRITPDGEWTVRAQYDGWPNGMRSRPDGSFVIADYKRGILRLDPASGQISPLIESYRSEGFKGCNDLYFAPDGTLYFTDQGQSGLHDPTGRVFRATPGVKTLEPIIHNGPSPNGLVLSADNRVLYVAMTRSCEVWRMPLFAEGTSKVNLFARLPAGISGPDGMTLDEDGHLYVCHASRGVVYVFDPLGDQVALIDCTHIGMTVTNLVFGDDGQKVLFITVSDAGVIARATSLRG